MAKRRKAPDAGAFPDFMERVRATRRLVGTNRSNEDFELAAFLELFHPELDDDKKRKIRRAREGA